MGNSQGKEQSYIQGLVNGDTQIIKTIYQNFAPRILQQIIKQGGTKEDVEDIFQDALLIIFNKAQQPDFQLTSGFYTYLYGICQYLYFNKKKKKSNQVITLEADKTFTNSGIDIEQDLVTIERKKLYDDILAQLSSICRQILTQGAKGFSITEIKQQLGLSSNAYTRLRKNRCKHKLLTLIKKDKRYRELSNFTHE